MAKHRCANGISKENILDLKGPLYDQKMDSICFWKKHLWVSGSRMISPNGKLLMTVVLHKLFHFRPHQHLHTATTPKIFQNPGKPFETICHPVWKTHHDIFTYHIIYSSVRSIQLANPFSQSFSINLLRISS